MKKDQSIDLNEIPQELDRQVLPEGVYRVRCEVMPGDEDGDLTRSASGFLLYLKIHFHIKTGEYKGRIIYDQINVELSDAEPPANKEDNYKWAVQNGRARVRALIEAANGIAPNDNSPKARQKRKIEEWAEIDGISCKIRVGIQPASGSYLERNVVLGVVHDPPPRGYDDTSI